MHRTEGPKLLNKVSLNTVKARRNIGKCRQGDTITNCRYMSLMHWNAGKARLDNGLCTMTYECGISRVHVNMNSIRQLIKPWAAGTFAMHPVSLAPCDNKSETPTYYSPQGVRVSTATEGTKSKLLGFYGWNNKDWVN
jgi:hypothetical protein